MVFKIVGRAISSPDTDVEEQVIEVDIDLNDGDITFNASENDAYIGLNLKDLERIIAEAKSAETN